MGPRSLNMVKTIINRTPGEVIMIGLPVLLKRLEMAAYQEARQLTLNRLCERITLSSADKDDTAILLERLGGSPPTLRGRSAHASPPWPSATAPSSLSPASAAASVATAPPMPTPSPNSQPKSPPTASHPGNARLQPGTDKKESHPMKTDYYTDPSGEQVPAKYVKPYDKQRDKIANQIAKLWLAERERIAKVKADTLAAH
jgi:hypothetical protein